MKEAEEIQRDCDITVTVKTAVTIYAEYVGLNSCSILEDANRNIAERVLV